MVFPERIFFFARTESSVRTDIATMKRLGAQSVVVFTDAVKALESLMEVAKAQSSLQAVRMPNLLVCDEYVGSMHCVHFLQQLAVEKDLRSLPLLVLSSNEPFAVQLQTVNVSSIVRPYAPTLLAQVVTQCVEKPTSLTVQALEEIAPAKKQSRTVRNNAQLLPMMTTQDWYSLGLQSYYAGNLGLAEQAFQTVITRQDDHVDALLGLACVYNKQADVENSQHFLLVAAAQAFRQNLVERANAIQKKLPATLQMGNIFFHEALSFVQRSDYKRAALSLLDAAKHQSEVPLHTLVARVSQFTARPEYTLDALCVAYDGVGQSSTAQALRQRLLYNYEASAQELASSWLDNFPLVRDVLHVASYTAYAWRQI